MVACAFLAGCDSPPQPSAPVELAFAGSASCAECHADEYQRWQGSHHALAMQPATADTILADFDAAEFSYYGETTTFARSADGSFVVRTAGSDGELQDFTVRYAFGVTPLQQYLVELRDGHLQALPFSWDSRPSAAGGQRWFHLYPDEDIRSDDALHWTGREQNWNYMCAECHSTNLQKNYDLATDTFATDWSEINVGCEGCHGPGTRHIARKRDGGLGSGLVVDLDDGGNAAWQMNTETGIAERSELLMRPPAQPEACGRCHARRALATGDYEYGKPLHDTHLPALLDEHLYFPDGQILEEVYVYGSFLQSRMYRAGVTCSDCHEPHSATLRTGAEPNDVCSTCHLPTRFADASHHRHESADVGCVDCHMTDRNYMVVDPRRDHSFRVPRPDLTLRTGSPNACNACHDDRDASWANGVVEDWYGPRQDDHYATAIHAGRAGSPGANERLVAAIRNTDYPGIARATAISLLRPPLTRDALAVLAEATGDGDSLVRAAAYGGLAGGPPEALLQVAGNGLADPVRGVRIAAARVLSPMQSSLRVAERGAFEAANRERAAAQAAIAERPEAHMNLGNLYADAGDIGTAEAEFRRALAMEPQAAAARVNLSQLLGANGQLEAAETALRDGLAATPDDALLQHALGLLLVRSGRQEEALALLAVAAEGQPDNARFTYVYAVALNSLGQPAPAIERLRAAVERFPGDFDMRWALITILRDEGRLDEARAAATALANDFPGIDAAGNLLRSLGP